jgi:transcriptional regulator with GAF, ATPase, and Fis domain
MDQREDALRGRPSAAYTGRDTGWNELAEKLSGLSRTLQDQNDLDETLHAIVQAAVDTVPGAEHASLSSVLQRREVHTRAATSRLPRQVDDVQYELGQGPCLDSLFENRTVRLERMDVESPWPKFTERAAELGVGSMLAVQLFVEGEDLGALNLFSTRPDAFTDESEQIGLLFAAHAAVALAGAQEEQHLRDAMGTRDLIGQAKGILMELYKIDAQEAFRMLVVASQHTNIKLRDVAEYLAHTGRLTSEA